MHRDECCLYGLGRKEQKDESEWTMGSLHALETQEMEDSPEYLRRYGEKIPAEVPGNVELDLERAGREPEPFYAENIYRFRKYEFYRWQFERSFDAPEHRTSSRWLLVFEGLNCFADVYLNDEWVGESANAMIAHPFDVTDVLRYGQSNRLTVRIRSAHALVLVWLGYHGPFPFSRHVARHAPGRAEGHAHCKCLLRHPLAFGGWNGCAAGALPLGNGRADTGWL